MDLDQALAIVQAAGYTVKYKKQKSAGIQTINPLNHLFPHAKLNNIKLTSISRLGAAPRRQPIPMIANNDPRNWTLSGKTPNGQ